MDNKVKKLKKSSLWVVAGLVVFGLLLLGLAYYWQNNDNEPEQGQTQVSEVQVEDDEQTEKMYVSGQGLNFKYPEDLDSVPEQLPAGFVSYLSGILEQNRLEAETGSNCVTEYGVVKFSSDIVRGGRGEVISSDSVSESACGGGGLTVWRADDDGVWSEIYGGHEPPGCEILEANSIPPEFEERCFGENGEGPFFNPLAPRNYEVVNL